jgi:prepilin-type N-terminal cleavage/methylation domain-containing protein
MSVAAVIRTRLGQERGVTLTELLVVLVILAIVLAAMTTLFVSAGTSQVEQTNRVDAQQEARVALDALRRELRCASSAVVTASSLTVTLPGYCQKPVAATSAQFTWCAVGSAAPYALWRYEGTACTGTGRERADELVSSSIFSYNRANPGPVQNALVAGSSITDGYFKPGTYSYAVTAVTAAGEISGAIKQLTITTGTPNQITVSWSPYTGASSYNVYGRDDGTYTNEGLRKLTNTTLTSWVDAGCATPAVNCSPAVVVDSSLASPPLATVGFALSFDVTTADGRQRFSLEDDVVLRNSGRY